VRTLPSPPSSSWHVPALGGQALCRLTLVALHCLVKGRLCTLAAARHMHGGTLSQVCEALQEGVAELEGVLSQLECDRVLAEPGEEPPGESAAAHVPGSGSAADARAGLEGSVVVGQAYRRVFVSVHHAPVAPVLHCLVLAALLLLKAKPW
jgi:hypothetical protein